MLDQETIDAFVPRGDLSAYTLYHAEVARLARFSREEQEELVARARQGQDEARQLLLLNCLRWTLLFARRMYYERQPQHVDLLDLAAEANLKMVEKMDKALAAHDPVAYLLSIAAQEIRVYCTYRAPLIQRPTWYSRTELAALAPLLAPLERLDVPRGDESKTLRHEHVAAPTLDLEPEEEKDQRTHARFTLLYHALHRLSQQQRATTIRLYGLCGQPTETPNELATAWHLKPQSVRSHAREARRRLSQMLAEQLPQMR